MTRRMLLQATAGAAANGAAKLNVVCVGGHPDDPESGCGGALARYAELGHSVTIVYLTRGERGIAGKSLAEAAAIRAAEARKACAILGAKPVFAGQIDGEAEVTRARLAQLFELVSAEKPDLLFTHWQQDTHMDHQCAGILTFQIARTLKLLPQLYHFEVNSGSQTMNFNPTHYVDITAVREKKKAALFAHKSQDGEAIYRNHHEVMENFRGRQAGVAAAEGFVRLARSGGADRLPAL